MMMKAKTERIIGIAVVAVLAMCAVWTVLATALVLQMYLPPFTTKGDFISHMDLMVEMKCLASSLNIALPVALLASIAGGFLARRRMLPVLAACIAALLFFISVIPVIPLMNHFDKIHGEDLSMWAEYVWWIPG